VRCFDPNASIFVRFKYNASKTPADKNIIGVWYVGDYRQIKYGGGRIRTPIHTVPRKDVVRCVHEFSVPANAVASDGYLAVAFYNEPVNGTTVVFPVEDGLEVLYRAGSFGANYIRAVLLIFIRLVFLAGLGVSLSTWLSFPVAILCCLTVFFTGLMHSFVVGSFDYLGENVSVIYRYTVKPLIWLLPKFDGRFNVGNYIVDSKLISITFFVYAGAMLLIKACVLLVAGMLIFARREIAKVTV